MSIVVTPIPQLIELAAPAFTLGTANAAGSAATAVASDSTLLAFDTTNPAAVAASPSVGSATTATRRDHVHNGGAYETGTWTGTILFGGGQTGNGYETQTCSYVKVGDQVTIWGEIQLNTKGSDTGNLTFGGLPFAVADDGSQDRAGTGLYAGQCTFADAPFIFVIQGDTTIRAQQLTNAGGGSSLTNANVAANSQFILNLSYGA